jgi:opacity protein-like surface antigen
MRGKVKVIKYKDNAMFVCRATNGMLLTILLVGLCVPIAYGATLSNHRQNFNPFSPSIPSIFDSYFVTFSAGPTWRSGSSKSQTLLLTPSIQRTYAADKRNRSLQSGEIYFGLQKTVFGQLQGQIGLAVALTNNTKFSGEIWDDNAPQFNNYSYSYDVQHAHMALKGKILADLGYTVIPWISGSFGVGINKSHNYLTQSLLFEAVNQPGFSTHLTPAFTYALGAGIQRIYNKNWQIGFGYEFADWGRNQLGQTYGQTIQNFLALQHLYTHNLLLNISYLA